MTNDARVSWIRDNVVLGLEVTNDQFDELLARNGGIAGLQLKDYLDGALRESTLLFYTITAEQPTEALRAQEPENTPRDDPDDEDSDEKQDKQDEFSEGDVTPEVPAAIPSPRNSMTTKEVKLEMSLQHLPQDTTELRSMYFWAVDPSKPLPSVGSPESIRAQTAAAMEFGVLSGHVFVMLEQAISDVYLPLVSQTPAAQLLSETAAEAPDRAVSSEPKLMESLRGEFLGNMHKFASQISHAVQQVSGDIRLTVPQIAISDTTAAADDDDLVAKLETAVEEWTSAVRACIETQLAAKCTDKGPIAEIDYWRDRNAVLSTLYEQLNTVQVKPILEVLEKVDSPVLATFKYQYSDLMKYYVEAKDNVKFLTTLERHFKNITLNTICDTLPPMMNAIRMVWIVSRHYNRDERMVPLMERIAWSISQEVSENVNVRAILRKPPSEAMDIIQKAQKALDKWRDTYFEVRGRIESSGRDQRWEFDRRRLFDQTTYMSTRCKDLEEVTRVLEQFRNWLTPELRAVIGDSVRIDEIVRRINSLVVPIESVPFDVFDRHYETSWDTVMSKFEKDVVAIEEMTNQFIDAAFKKLRSAEGAFELLQNFRNIQSRTSIQRKMMEKFTDILLQYSREVEQVRSLFERDKSRPPITKGQPPTAGAIMWSRALFHRIKKTMLRFQTLPELMETESGRVSKQQYIAVGKAIRDYERKLYADWASGVDAILLHLRAPLLREGMGGHVEVNFHPDVRRLIKETRHLDRLGFKVPESALNVALQEEKYHRFVEQLTVMLTHYHGVLELFKAPERQLLDKHIQQFRRVLDPGFTPLNWNSLGVSDFIVNANRAINAFHSLVEKIMNSASTMQGVVNEIAGTSLGKIDMNPKNPPDLQELYIQYEKERTAKVELLLESYRSIPKLLGKIEELVAGTNTGRSPMMVDYYAFWERKVFNALNRMILAGLSLWMAALRVKLISDSASALESKSHLDKACAPIISHDSPPGAICRITASLSAPEIVLSPNAQEIYRLVVNKICKGTVELSKQFVRWMDSTCIESPPVQPKSIDGKTLEDDEPVVYSFYPDVSSNPQIVRCMVSINQSIKSLFAAKVNKFIEGWSRFRPLWKQDKNTTFEKFKSRGPDVITYDNKLAFYSRLAKDVPKQLQEKDIEWMRIDCEPLIQSIESEASAWVAGFGRLLNESAKAGLDEMIQRFERYVIDLKKTPETLTELKFVLGVIAEIREESVNIELAEKDVVEKYWTLQLYAIDIPQKDIDLAFGLHERWMNVLLLADAADAKLVRVKEEFSKVTQQQVRDFLGAVSQLKQEFITSGPGTASKPVHMDGAVEKCRRYQARLEDMSTTRDSLVLAEKLFNLPITSYPLLSEVESDLQGLSKIFTLYVEQKDKIETWSSTLWAELDIVSLGKEIERLHTSLRKLDKDLRMLPPYKVVEEKINNFRESVPLLQDMKSDALRDRHWKKLMKVTQKDFDLNPNTFTLSNLFAMELHNFAEQIAEITSGAVKELNIENGIKSIAEAWKQIRFEIQRYTKGHDDRGYILKTIDDIQQQLDDNFMTLQTMALSRFVQPFVDEVHAWEKRLSLIGEVCEIWMQVQRKWMYLEGIFLGSDDIRLQLPEEARKFDNLDKTWKKLMADTAKNTNVLEATHQDGRLMLLTNLSDSLDACQKSLSDYLDTKRNAFPRFFFISDDELLSILGSHEPAAVQEHMIKLFENVHQLVFGEGRDARQVLGMRSLEGEQFMFKTPQIAEGNVENWMTQVEAEMRRTLQYHHKEAVFKYARMDRLQWLNQFLGMAVLCGSQVWWTFHVEEVFRNVRSGDKRAMKKLLSTLRQQIEDLVNGVRGNMDGNARSKVTTLIIVDVHARDIVERFVRDSILDEREFEWESQLRYYWDREKDTVLMRQCTGEFEYGFEYMGLNGRLVITPLTDRCVMTLTQALSMNMGGSPAGPAGTGKTETVKDLAKASALMCIGAVNTLQSHTHTHTYHIILSIVMNCGEGIDYKAMGRVFSGLVQTGAWGCFDEFNRIDAEVLSVISAQIRTIQNALAMELKHFHFEGREIRLAPSLGIFITMNPGYAGRTELPDNLKALFRPVVMVVPDMELICEIMLFSEGFTGAKVLAKKMTVLYKLSREQLSKQHHYDFGLRALKAVLVMAGSLKRESEGLPEDVVLMRALRDMNLPKFVFDDVPLFLGLVQDLFPGIDCPRVRYPGLHDAVEQSLDEEGYVVLADQVDKVVQLYETMQTRHTTMLVGPTGGGKSVVMKTLARAQTKLGLPTKLHILNAKAVTVSELYGVLDPNTRDWTDGLLSNIFREINKPTEKKDRRYIVFDGDVDAVWVENMNSVMDDNKLLTLPNGERIRLLKNCAMLFEVGDLQYASPATVSRCGMVFVDPKNLGYEPYFRKWNRERYEGKAQMEIFDALFDKYVIPCVDYVTEGLQDGVITKKLKTIIPISNLILTRQLCSLLEAIVTEEANYQEAGVLEAIFVFCIIWSVGGSVVDEDRSRFDSFIKKVADMVIIDNPDLPVGTGQIPATLPTLYDFYFDPTKSQWVSWESMVPEYKPKPDHKFSGILVPTVDTMRNEFLLRSMAEIKKPVLFVGGAGCGKTLTIQHYLRGLDPETTVVLTLNFSSRTTSADVQRTLEDNVDKLTKDTYGPPAGKKMIVFIDDLNMPKVDKYGTQQPTALLKLLLDRGGLYDRWKDLSWKNFRDMQFMAAMAPPGGGRNHVDPRFVSLFNVFNISFPSDGSLLKIFSSILMKHLENFSDEVQKVGHHITPITLKLYRAVVSHLPPTPSKFHYIFNLRDLSRVFEGLCLSTVDKFEIGETLVRLWRNECLRVFHDRLVTQDDKLWVQDKIGQLVKHYYPRESQAALEDPILFGDFRNVMAPEEVKLYEDLGDYDTIKPIFEEVLDEYNETHPQTMNLVLFQDALEHLTRIYRIIRLPRGNALLVGVGGSGKTSLTRLAAFAAGYSVFEIALCRGYAEVEFKEDLKRLYSMLGAEGKEVVFLFTDAHVAQESFLESINNMLTSGMVPALFAEDEKEEKINAVRDEVLALGVFDSRANLWEHYVNKCRDNLHIVLCMSPAGDTLRHRCRNFPGLISNTVIDWFDRWPKQALYSVSNVFLAEEDLPARYRPDIINHMVNVHLSVAKACVRFEQSLRRNNYVTPKNYLDYINNYRRLLTDNRKETTAQIQRLEAGVEKLVQAAQEVDVMNEDLIKQKADVEIATQECNELLEQIGEATQKTEQKKQVATTKEGELQESHIRIAQEKEEAEAALAEALPALEEARAALENLDRDDITEIRSFAKPHILVQSVCECVVILRGLKDVSWKGAKAMMASTTFLQDLLSFDKDSITEKQIRLVRERFKIPNFTVDAMKTISRAGAGLLAWVRAIVNYYGVAKVVAPKKAAVARSEKQLKQSVKDLERINAEVQALSEELERLGEMFAQKTVLQQQLRDKAELMERRLIAAKKLISGLGSEQVRWSEEMVRDKAKLERLVGDCLLAAGFLSYCGAFSHDFRHELLDIEWQDDLLARSIPLTQPFELEQILTDEVEMAQWTAEGLPPDSLSIQNGIVITRASRWPLCIDPQMQAVEWIRHREKDNGLKVATFNDPDFLKHLEVAIKFGMPFLFEGVDEYIDPVIDSILEKNIQVVGNRMTITLGDTVIEYDPNFRLYLTTKLGNPKYAPEVFGKCMIINFNVTPVGLEDQLLNAVVGYERADLERQRLALIHDTSVNKSNLKRLEATLLRELSSAKGMILDNAVLIKTLETSKEEASGIKVQLDQADVTAREIESVRSGYRPAAKRGALLFFAMAGLNAISSMYEYSLTAYNDVFLHSLQRSKKDSLLTARLNNIIDTVTTNVYSYTCTSLFEAHKLLFSFAMTIAIMKGEDEINQGELDFFIKGKIALDKSDRTKPYAWIPEQGWEDMQRLMTISPVFEHLAEDIESNEDEWRVWYDSDAPESTPIPMDYDSKLSLFQRMCVLRCFRVDRVYLAVTKFVIQRMGEKYVQPPVVNYELIHQQSSYKTPIVFILSPGADPASDIFKLGDKLGFGGNKLKFLSLGQGQGPVALQLLETGVTRGQWVVLQNCHLAISFMPRLARSVESLQNDRVHKDFRLWLTTEPTKQFPLNILQRSLKVVTEPPNGLKLNMRNTYAKIAEETLSQCPHPAYRPLVFVLAFFHAVVQERRKYGKIGWTNIYDFNESDFRVSLMLLNTYLTKAHVNKDAAIPWGSLRYLIGEAMYGGRVTDGYDRRVLKTYLDEYMGDFLFDTYQPFHFFKNDDYDYKIPDSNTLEDYVNAVESMPLVNTPEIFGLHANAEITYLTNATRDVWLNMIDMQPRTADIGTGMSKDDFITQLVADLQPKIPAPFDISMVQSQIGSEVLTPVQVVLLQELERWNKLVVVMANSLRDLMMALQGEIGMSADLDALVQSLFAGTIPDQWRRLSPQTGKNLSGWMAHFQRRYEQYMSWIDNGEPVVMWLPGLHVPEAYLTALVQTTCRANKWPLDRTTLYTEVTDFVDPLDVKSRPPSGCYMSGLYLEGAGWDRGGKILRKQDPMQLYEDMPILRVIPIETHRLKLQGTCKVPVYVTQDRRDAMGVGWVFDADLPTDVHDSHWVLQGVCLVLNVS